MQGQYDAGLVVLSFVTAVIASFVALDMAARVAASARQGRGAALWLGCGAFAMGSGIWAMHFVGMLAFSLPVPLAYELRITGLSWLVAVASSALALNTVSRPTLGLRRLLVAGSLMGVGIAAMHYLGMEALQMHPRIAYDPLLFMLSVLFAVTAATAALLISFLLRHETVVTGLRKRIASSLVMGGAIVGMHYTGMAAANFADGSVCRAGPVAVGGAWLAFVISGLVALLLVITLLSSVYRAMPPTIRSRLVFLVVAAMLPVSLMALVVMFYDYERLRARQADDLIGTARAITEAIDKDLAGIEAGLRVLSTSRVLQTSALAGFHQQATDARDHLQVVAIALEDGHGAVLVDTSLPFSPPAPARDPSSPSHTPSVPPSSNVELAADAPAGGQRMLTLSVPAPPQDHVLRARLAPERFTGLLRRQQLAPDWIVSVYNHEGTIIARTHEMARFLGSKGAPGLLRRLAEVNEDAVDAVTLEGIPVLAAFSRSPGSGWAVSIGIPRESLHAPLRRTLAGLLGGLALMLGASLWLAWRIGGGIAGAVKALTEPALALGAGLPVSVPPLGLTEADKVGRALTQAAHLLGEAQREANHDALTGLANRSLFRQMVQQQLAVAQRSGGGLAVLYVDLDGFKGVNDSHGHAVGDLMLQEAAHRLQQGVRAGDLVARLGGDEFAVALVQPGRRGAAKVAAKLVESLSQPFQIGPLTLQISASIGGAGYEPAQAPDPVGCDALLQQADEAMYRAKRSGKRQYVLAGSLMAG